MGRGGVVMPQTLHGLPSISWQSILAKGKCHLEWAFIVPAKMQIKTIVTENWRVHLWSVVFSGLCGNLYSNHAADQPEVTQPFGFPWLRSISLSPGLSQVPLMQLTHRQPTQMSSDWTCCIPTLGGPTVLGSLTLRETKIYPKFFPLEPFCCSVGMALRSWQTPVPGLWVYRHLPPQFSWDNVGTPGGLQRGCRND